MRRLFLLSALILSAGSFADTLINIPTGRKVPYGVLRFEGRFAQSDFRQFQGDVSYGIDTNFDARLTYADFDGQRRVVTGDFSYNYVSPITGILPGISIGVLDVANENPDGRRPYLTSTYRIGGADYNSPVELTWGTMYAKRPIGFFGLSFPFSEQFRFLAEDDGRQISAGFEWRQSDALAFRWYVQDTRPVMSVRWETHL